MSDTGTMIKDPETLRLEEDAARRANWKRWGPYLSERQWGTVREDYSPHGTSWEDLPHDHARSRAYRWGEDGLLGITDRECRLAFAVALWNGRDPILKERLFGLTGPEGNHGEDVKETYWYLDSTPTHSYLHALYRYPQARYPYEALVENGRRGRHEREVELGDLGVFDEDRFFDVRAEYAKAEPDDILIRVTVTNHGPDPAPLYLLPTLWLRNTWSWECAHEGCGVRPRLLRKSATEVEAVHATLGSFVLRAEAPTDGPRPELLFTENETNLERLYGVPNSNPYVKDAFHTRVVDGRVDAVNPDGSGTKAAFLFVRELGPGEVWTVRLRLSPNGASVRRPFGPGFERVFKQRMREADLFYERRLPAGIEEEQRRVSRQAYAGLLWTKQFYHYVVESWLSGDPGQPPPPSSRLGGRNAEWKHVHARDVISVPDKWEYPWFAAWDLAFHVIPLARVDPQLAKDQLALFLREWYMHPNGQIPAYEFALGDVNPPVHAWACWRVYKMTGPRGARDRTFLASCFQKLLLNFTWWVNRKDLEGRHLFTGGFLGLDNIGVFDRSRPLPTGGHLEQADGTAWMAFYCATMLAMALELAREDRVYEDLASKFLEHFVHIAQAMNTLGGTGLWDDVDGFFYDHLHVDGRTDPLRVRSMVGLVPLFAAEVLEPEVLEHLPGFAKRFRWFVENRPELAAHLDRQEVSGRGTRWLLAVPSKERLIRVLRRLLDEQEFLSPHGVRSVSRWHLEHPFVLHANGEEHRVDYVPGESDTGLFGGNSNWRGPIWFPVNFLLIEALERYHYFYGRDLTVECPTGSGSVLDLREVARELAERLVRPFLPDERGVRPLHGDDPRAGHPLWRDHLLFHEYFHGDDGRGLGASHQTGWTALVARLVEDLAPRAATPVGPSPPPAAAHSRATTTA